MVEEHTFLDSGHACTFWHWPWPKLTLTITLLPAEPVTPAFVVTFINELIIQWKHMMVSTYYRLMYVKMLSETWALQSCLHWGTQKPVSSKPCTFQAYCWCCKRSHQKHPSMSQVVNVNSWKWVLVSPIYAGAKCMEWKHLEAEKQGKSHTIILWYFTYYVDLAELDDIYCVTFILLWIK